MLCIENQEQNEFVMSLLPVGDDGGYAKAWLAYTDRIQEGSFLWDGGGWSQDTCESTFEAWGTGQPLSVSSRHNPNPNRTNPEA